MIEQGAVIFMDFNPTKGHEQRGQRPALVVSNDDYNKIMGLAIVCPISNTTKKFPTHIILDERTKTTGAIFCEHLRSVDLNERNARFIEMLPNDLFEEALEIITSLF